MNKRNLLIGACAVMACHMGVMHLAKDSVGLTVEKIIRTEGHGVMDTQKITISHLSPYLGGTHVASVVLSSPADDIVLIKATVTGSTLFDFYVEIDGTQMFKISQLL